MSSRGKILLVVVVFLLVVRLGWSWIANRGLITVHADKQALSEVIRSIERQGGIRLQPNFDAATPVTMNVTKVPLGEALETLAAATDARWELAYVAAPNRAQTLTWLAQRGAGERPEDWVNIRTPMPRGLDDAEEEVPIDPRHDRWEAKTPADATLRGYFEAAAANVNASFILPAAWNPPVAKSPGEGAITKLAPKLVGKAGGEVVETFLLTRRPERSPQQASEMRSRWTGGGGTTDSARSEGGARADFDPARMEQRMEAQIAKLPEAEKSAARARMQERRQFWQSLRDLPEEQRRELMRERMSDPAAQARFEERSASRDSRRSPEQRRDRYQRYAERKAATKAN